jgi:hypothetical protein
VLPFELQRVQLFVTLLTFRDPRLLGHDAAVATEVIEHMDAPRFAAFESVLFGFVRPPTIIITTPNQEYNVKWRIQFEHGLRHKRHQFEWTRREFDDWAARRANASGYAVRVAPIGPSTPSGAAHADGGVHAESVAWRPKRLLDVRAEAPSHRFVSPGSRRPPTPVGLPSVRVRGQVLRPSHAQPRGCFQRCRCRRAVVRFVASAKRSPPIQQRGPAR